MSTLPFAIYDAFTDVAYGGSPAGVVFDAEQLSAEYRHRIAVEVGAPATGFVTGLGDDWVAARFHSRKTEYPMCGHGTICMLTALIDEGRLGLARTGRSKIQLRMPNQNAWVEIEPRSDGRFEIFLDIKPPEIQIASLGLGRLLELLGIDSDDLDASQPPVIADGDFVHLVLTVNSLKSITQISPDQGGLKAFKLANGLETIAVMCHETTSPQNSIHLRDFCTAVGVDESAAAGTTNAAVAACLYYFDRLPSLQSGVSSYRVEQGMEMQRPSEIRVMVQIAGDGIQRLQVGGIASRTIRGEINSPEKF